MKNKYLYCHRCEDYEEFKHTEDCDMPLITPQTGTYLSIYECQRCKDHKVEIESKLEKRINNNNNKK